jgi:hypothetical protein
MDPVLATAPTVVKQAADTGLCLDDLLQSSSFLASLRAPTTGLSTMASTSSSALSSSSASSSKSASHTKRVQSFPASVIDVALQSTTVLISLNKDQSAVLHSIARWYSGDSSNMADSNILLVRGVFGSGKSLLLAAVCIFLKYCEQYENERLLAAITSGGGTGRNRARDNQVHISTLVSSNTNVAVDRVLNILVDIGKKHLGEQRDKDEASSPRLALPVVARVGCVTKIDKQLRPYLIATKDHKPTLLRDIALAAKQDTTCGDNSASGKSIDGKSVLEQLMERVKRPDFQAQQSQYLQLADVVGVTCASASSFGSNSNDSTSLANKSFDVLILDEASQMTEPLSLLPIARAKCSKMIVVGDPLQLPPTLIGKKDDNGDSCWLGTTLFDRLARLGYPMITLRTQYRCHPDIANICRYVSLVPLI